MTDIQRIKQISIRDYLTQRGINPKQQNTRYGLYLSPLREEHSPSFKVDYIQNLWYDFGLGVGGSIIDLVMHMERCNAAEAMRRLERHIGGMSVSSLSPSGFSSSRLGRAIQNCSALAPQRRFIGKNPAPQRPPSIIVERVQPLENPALLDYLMERGIGLDTAHVHCSEVHYRVADKFYFAVGFRNDAGGWDLRNRYFKGCTSKAPTTRRGDYPTCLVFEGFMNYLSYLTLKRNPTPPHNIAVLNSVTNLAKVVPFIASHEQVYAYLDNDEAGRKATTELKAACRNLSDQSVHYRPHNDLNDYLRSQRPVKEHRRSHGCKL
ncbi:toprim domain-containing protein [uncultured Alistipes sp.]|uniref:toprim domain-containing protein n=1 Tax=uncultured Alistipes sp. TaxID=538949 RepID=UPI0026EC124E|nr:toprim domain-containing protein [uncultured Alistipes sp.]